MAAQLIQIVFRWGNSASQDLVRAVQNDASPNPANNYKVSILSNGLPKSNHRASRSPPNPATGNLDSIENTIRALLNARLISQSHESFFRTETDNYAEAASRIQEVAVAKMSKRDQEASRNERIMEILDDWKYGLDAAAVEGSQAVRKRPLETNGLESSIKRRRLNSDTGALLNGSVLQAKDDRSQASPKLKGDQALCLNHAKFAVLLRNDRLVSLVESRLCSATAQVYRALLEELQPSLLDCHYNDGRGVHDDNIESLQVTTDTLAAIVPDSEVLRNALGPTENRESDTDMLEHPKKRRRKDNVGPSSRAESSDELSGISEDDPEVDASQGHNFNHAGFQAINRNPHQIAVRSHLQLLAQHPFNFVTQVTDPFSRTESWTVDLPSLVRTMQVLEIDQTIASCHGPIALRLVNILREHGKLDDRALASLALIREKELRSYLTTMQQAGLLELQEVPRDNARLASRTSFLFFFDHERCVRRLLEDAYKMMTRLLQRFRIEKERVQVTLDKASRSDVVGHEEQLLSQAERDALKQWKKVEEKLWSQVESIDDTVALLRDF